MGQSQSQKQGDENRTISTERSQFSLYKSRCKPTPALREQTHQTAQTKVQRPTSYRSKRKQVHSLRYEMTAGGSVICLTDSESDERPDKKLKKPDAKSKAELWMNLSRAQSVKGAGQSVGRGESGESRVTYGAFKPDNINGLPQAECVNSLSAQRTAGSSSVVGMTSKDPPGTISQQVSVRVVDVGRQGTMRSEADGTQAQLVNIKVVAEKLDPNLCQSHPKCSGSEERSCTAGTDSTKKPSVKRRLVELLTTAPVPQDMKVRAAKALPRARLKALMSQTVAYMVEEKAESSDDRAEGGLFTDSDEEDSDSDLQPLSEIISLSPSAAASKRSVHQHLPQMELRLPKLNADELEQPGCSSGSPIISRDADSESAQSLDDSFAPATLPQLQISLRKLEWAEYESTDSPRDTAEWYEDRKSLVKVGLDLRGETPEPVTATDSLTFSPTQLETEDEMRTKGKSMNEVQTHLDLSPADEAEKSAIITSAEPGCVQSFLNEYAQPFTLRESATTHPASPKPWLCTEEGSSCGVPEMSTSPEHLTLSPVESKSHECVSQLHETTDRFISSSHPICGALQTTAETLSSCEQSVHASDEEVSVITEMSSVSAEAHEITDSQQLSAESLTEGEAMEHLTIDERLVQSDS